MEKIPTRKKIEDFSIVSFILIGDSSTTVYSGQYTFSFFFIFSKEKQNTDEGAYEDRAQDPKK